MAGFSDQKKNGFVVELPHLFKKVYYKLSIITNNTYKIKLFQRIRLA